MPTNGIMDGSISLHEGSTVLSSAYLSMYPGVELRTMRYIVAVGTELHFSRAAERVHAAQPSLSKQIRNVEEELGVELFKRNRRNVEITDAGRAFIENAQQALLFAEACRCCRSGGQCWRARQVAAGCLSIHRSRAFPSRVGKAFEKRYADVQFQFVSAFAGQQAEWVMPERSSRRVDRAADPVTAASLS